MQSKPSFVTKAPFCHVLYIYIFSIPFTYNGGVALYQAADAKWTRWYMAVGKNKDRIIPATLNACKGERTRERVVRNPSGSSVQGWSFLPKKSITTTGFPKDAHQNITPFPQNSVQLYYCAPEYNSLDRKKATMEQNIGWPQFHNNSFVLGQYSSLITHP